MATSRPRPTYDDVPPELLGLVIAGRIEEARIAYYARLDETNVYGREITEAYPDFDDCENCLAREALAAIDEYLFNLSVQEQQP